MYMALAAALVAPRTRTSPATCVPGKCPAKEIDEHNLTVFIVHRQLLLCRVALGKSFLQYSAMKMAHAPPGHHSVIGRPSAGGLHFAEYVVYRGEQVRIELLIKFVSILFNKCFSIVSIVLSRVLDNLPNRQAR